MNKVINKSMDLHDLDTNDAKIMMLKLIELDNYFKNNDCNISSWYGNINNSAYYKKLSLLNRGYNYKLLMGQEIDERFPSFLIWEIYWVVKNLDIKPNTKLLDIGGSCSLFSFYMEKLGVEVTAIDINKDLVDSANEIAKKLNLNYRAICADAEEFILSSNEKYDYITSICVFEHMPLEKRKKIINYIDKILTNDGKVALTFDYKNPSRFVNINSEKDVIDQFAFSNKLKQIGNQGFYDNNINYLIHPFYRKPIFWKYKYRSIKKGNFPICEILKTKKDNDYSFGAIFLEKNKELI